MSSASPASIRVRIHERGDQRLDGILRLIEEAGRPQPLAVVLQTLCQAIADIARADVVSVYVAEREPDESDVLVLAANVGFPAEAVGRVRLRFGEGLTGVAAECLRPVSVAVGRHDERYKHVPDIGEERFPSYLGIPLLSGGAAAGVLVLQRRAVREFPPAEIALATALAAPVAFALERARGREPERDARPAPAAHTARLTGVTLAPGTALGRIETWPSLDGLSARTRGVDQPGGAVGVALAHLARELLRARLTIEPGLDRDKLVRLRSLALLLEDERFRGELVAKTSELGVGAGLITVARDYARAPYRLRTGDEAAVALLSERAAEVEDLCVLAGARVAGQPALSAGAVVVAERLTAMLALAAIARRAVAVVVSGGAHESALGAALARAGRLPVVAGVDGLFAWARPDDRVLVDGTEGAGQVRINPPATAVARFRAGR